MNTMDELFFEDTTGGEHNRKVTIGKKAKRMDKTKIISTKEEIILEDKPGKHEFPGTTAPSTRKRNMNKNKAKRIDDLFASLEPDVQSKKKKIPKYKNKNEVDIVNNTYIDLGRDESEGTAARVVSDVEELMNKSVITPGFDQLHAVPPYEVSQQMARKERMKEREKTKGSKWFNLPAPEMTSELKKELQVLQMRSVLDPKHFYKKNTMKTLPKYFQVGRVVEAPADFYHSRVPKKERKKTMVEELLADAQFKKYNKKRYTEIIEDRRKTNFKAHKHAKRLKNRKK